MVRHCRFKNSFIFKYSPRPGTIAIDRFEDDVPEDVKRRRNNELLAVQAEASARNNAEMVGKVVEVIVEGESKLVSRQNRGGSVVLGWENPQSDGETRTQLIGRTRGDQVICFDGPTSLKGEILNIEVTDAKNLTLFGRLARQPELEPAPA
jgi:tRNA-2-methylthio-N6-dimethylallyladenosine synthase